MGCASALALADGRSSGARSRRTYPEPRPRGAAAGILGAQTEAHEAGPFFDLAEQSSRELPGVDRASARSDGHRRRLPTVRVCAEFEVRGRESVLARSIGRSSWARGRAARRRGHRGSRTFSERDGIFRVHFARGRARRPPLLLKAAAHRRFMLAGARSPDRGRYVRSVDVVDRSGRGGASRRWYARVRPDVRAGGRKLVDAGEFHSTQTRGSTRLVAKSSSSKHASR